LVGFFSGMSTPVCCCDDREARAGGQGVPRGWNDRSVRRIKPSPPWMPITQKD
jgi:hypothetical protein